MGGHVQTPSITRVFAIWAQSNTVRPQSRKILTVVALSKYQC